jgi:hypothetical protein
VHLFVTVSVSVSVTANCVASEVVQFVTFSKNFIMDMIHLHMNKDTFLCTEVHAPMALLGALFWFNQMAIESK